MDKRTKNIGFTPLHYASFRGHKELAKLLIDHGANPNAADTRVGRTPLHFAVNSRRKETAQLLIEHGADINKTDKDGKTPLHLVIPVEYQEVLNEQQRQQQQQLNKDVAKLLIDLGADINVADKFGITPLHLVGDKDFANLLLNRGADMDMVTLGEYRQTPLLSAARRGYKRCRGWKGYLEVAQLMIERGADVDRVNRYGKSARDYLLMSDQRSQSDISEVE